MIFAKKITYVISIVIFLTLFIEFFHPINAINQDLGRHLITGEIILLALSVPKINLFSYTYPHFPFINTHWLSQVVFYLAFTLVGYSGLLVVTTITVLLAFSFIFYYTYKRADLVTISATSLLFFAILAERTDLRPEIFSFLFLAVFVSILYKNREKFTKLIFILPFIEILWVNTHIYFAIGEVITGLFLVDFFIKSKFKLNRDFLLLMIVFLGTIIATLFNPNGFQGAIYPLTVFNNYGYTIQENLNIFQDISIQGYDLPIAAFIFTVLLLFCVLILNIKQTKPIDWLITIAFAIIAYVAVRDLPLFVFAAFIPFTVNLSMLLKRFSNTLFIKDKNKNDIFIKTKNSIVVKSNEAITISKKSKYIYIIVILIIFSGFVWENATFISQNGFGWELPADYEPAVTFFLKNQLKGPIFNNFDIGSYLDYRLYPANKVFVDGRPEAYPAAFFQNVYIPMLENPNRFSIIDNIIHFNTIFLAITSQTPWSKKFEAVIMNNSKWTIVCLDSYSIILLKNTPQNLSLIKRFGITSQNLQLKNLNKDSINQLAYLSNLFSGASWTNQEAEVDKEILMRNNTQYLCTDLSELIKIYTAQQNYNFVNAYESRYQKNCK